MDILSILIFGILIAVIGGGLFLYFRGQQLLPSLNPIGKGMQPHEAARQFFAAIMESQCGISWALFSDASQKQFAEWALHEIYTRNKNSAEQANLGYSEVVLMFENNDSQVLKYFWRRFFFSSGAAEIFRFGYFDTVQVTGKNAIVKVSLHYPNGQTREIGLPMVQNRGVWCLAYVEHNLPF